MKPMMTFGILAGFNPEGYLNDIFEIAVDGNLSGGPFIFNPIYSKEELKWNSNTPAYLENHVTFSGYMLKIITYTPHQSTCMGTGVGSQPWIADFPYANYAYQYDFKHGESGKLVFECWITPF